MADSQDKLIRLQEILRECGSALVAFSGGVDSTFLVVVARETLGDQVLAVTARSATFPAHEALAADAIAQSYGLRHLVMQTDELENADFAANPPERCYFCKRELFGKLKAIAASHHLACIFDGTNDDDRFDHRPGLTAGRELGIRSPLMEAGLTKEEIRQLSKAMGLPNWDKPSQACLASRFPYGQRITRQKLAMVESAEAYLRHLGFNQLRVRHHGRLARIEVAAEEFPRVLSAAKSIATAFKEFGYAYVALDLLGYRTGSMNETLPANNPE